MNFLAHIYLSGNNELLTIGNFMADGIRGQVLNSFPAEVQKGIILHRFIDSYTDAHPIFRQSTKRLHPVYHHYSGVIVDIIYDHFLARNWRKYHDEPLQDFTQQFYQLLRDNYSLLTEKTKNMMPYMIQQDWLGSYATTTGIAEILRQMDGRTKQKSGMTNAVKELMAFYTDFESEFTLFFEDVRAFVKDKKRTL
ncbi:acyl carrier protein phosphodiesterase [Flavobacterium litorale]|uniref:Acyl carrier protein phosphodiesterase n=1 Tax=Flavobacterium litorale TaxID=2856519 RepID=A0ABX8VBT3_9FLAO|nr:acyl carrier protein phosphodiesterase [Flavobacterium litorale]QYJ68081.1 acyl carrier protein phosphodiesterase [Flavobacterium litorale]